MNRPDSFINFIREDKSKYKTARECGFVDEDDDFLVGDSGGFLFNISFTFTNTRLFSEAADFYNEHGTYCLANEDSPDWDRFRSSEEFKRRNGIVLPCKLKDGKVLPLRITGEHYNFLNYSRMNMLDESTMNLSAQTGSKKEGFPLFVDAQYWYFKAKEFARRNGFHFVVGKSRRGGFSYMEGADSANDVNLNPKQTVIHLASDTKYLTKGNAITAMAKTNLDFYETETPFKRGYLKEELDDLELGYKLPGSNIKYGYRSRLISLSFGNDNADVAAGKDAKKIKIDELNDAPNLNKVLEITEPTTRTGAFMTGQIIGFGTGGSKGGNWADFEAWFYKPSAYKAMPFENVWDESSRHTCCGFYKPYWWGLQGALDSVMAMDDDGNSLWDIAIQISEKERVDAKRDKGTEDYIVYCAMYSNFPAESFSAGVENPFTSPELNLHIDRVKHDPVMKFYRDGMILRTEEGLCFKTNDWLKTSGQVAHDYIEDVPFKQGTDVHGCLRMFFMPIRVKGEIPKGLYRIWFDPVGVNKDKDKVTNKHSLNSFHVYMRPNNITNTTGDILVASYCGRPPKMEDIDRIVLNVADFYDAMIMHENDRGQLISDARQWKKLHRLALEPTMAWDKNLEASTGRSYGVSMGSIQRKLTAVDYLKDWLYTERGVNDEGQGLYTFHYIYDLPTLLEIQKWTLSGNFDRVSSLLVGQYDIKETIVSDLKIKNPKMKVESIFKRNWYTKN